MRQTLPAPRDWSHSMQARKGLDLLSGHGVRYNYLLWRHFPILMLRPGQCHGSDRHSSWGIFLFQPPRQFFRIDGRISRCWISCFQTCLSLSRFKVNYCSSYGIRPFSNGIVVMEEVNQDIHSQTQFFEISLNPINIPLSMLGWSFSIKASSRLMVECIGKKKEGIYVLTTWRKFSLFYLTKERSNPLFPSCFKPYPSFASRC